MERIFFKGFHAMALKDFLGNFYAAQLRFVAIGFAETFVCHVPLYLEFVLQPMAKTI